MGNVISMADFNKKEEEEQLDGVALGATEMEQLEPLRMWYHHW